MLGSERLTGATLDRLTHRCQIIETKGESYRLRDAKARIAGSKAGPTERADEVSIEASEPLEGGEETS